MAGILRLVFMSLVMVIPFARQADLMVLEVAVLSGHRNLPNYEASYMLSPDGSTLAWLETANDLCLRALPSTVVTCHPVPAQYLELTLLAWSPSNQYLLLRDGIGEFSSHLTYAPETEKIELLEDEQIVSSRMIWGASDTTDDVYYLTYHYEGGVDFALLHRYSVTKGTDDVFDPRTVFDRPLVFTSVIPVSEDGTQFVLLLPYSTSPDTDGLWLVDTATLQAEHLAAFDDLAADLSPERQPSPGILEMKWDREQNRLLVPIISMMSMTSQYDTYMLTSIDLETGDVLPLLTTEDALMLTEDVSFSEGHITPDAEFFFYYDSTGHPEQKTVFALPLSSDVREPLMISQDFYVTCPRTSLLVTMGHDNIERNYLYEPHNFCPQ